MQATDRRTDGATGGMDTTGANDEGNNVGGKT